MAHDLEKKWRTKDVQLFEDADFASMLLCDRVLLGLSKAGFKKPSPIQLEAIPTGRFGKDLLVQAKSGTGKTLVFVIVALEMLHRKFLRPQVLILVPTREIATQICSVVKTVGSSFSKLTCESFIGGFSVEDDVQKANNCQIVVGTPGRIKQLISMKALSTTSVRLLVMDEADELLKYSWQGDIESIFNSLPEDKQVIATSATYPPKLKKIMFRYLRDPFLARLDSRKLALLGIVHYAKIVECSALPIKLYKLKLEALEPILKNIKFTQCLVYCNGIYKVQTLYNDIMKWGFSATYISSEKEQIDRLKAIDCLKRFKCKVLVSSDLTARGIDAENVDLVINFDISSCTETYLHRSGRAGRYGTVGATISIVDSYELNFLKRIEKQARFKSYQLPDPVPVDLVQKPSLEKFAVEVSEGDEYEEEENEEKFDVPIKKKNVFFNNEKHSTKNDNVEERRTSPKCSSTNNIAVSFEIPDNTSGGMSSSTNGTDENSHLSVKIKSQGCSLENDKSSVKENLKNTSICEDITDSTESFEVKAESLSTTEILNNDNLHLNFILPRNFKNSDISNGISSDKDMSLVILNECKTSEVSCGTSDYKDKNSAIMNDCKNSVISNVMFDDKDMSSSVLNECKNSKVSIVSSSENDCVVSTVEIPSDINAKEFPVQCIKNHNVEDCFQCIDLSSQYESNEFDSSLCRNDVSHDITIFVQQYETNRSMESQLSKNVGVLTDMENSMTEIPEGKSISDYNISDLNSRRSDYYYKVFKLFHEDNVYNNNEGKMQEDLNQTEPIPVENEHCVQEKMLSSEIMEEGKLPGIHEITAEPIFVMASELSNSNEFESAVADNPIPEIASVAHDDDIPNSFEISHENIEKPIFIKASELLNRIEFEKSTVADSCIPEMASVANDDDIPNFLEIISESTEEPIFVKASDLVNRIESESTVADDPIPEITSMLNDDIPNFFDVNHESTPCRDKSKFKITTLFDRSDLEQPKKKSIAFFDEISLSDTESDKSVSKTDVSESYNKGILDVSRCSSESGSDSELCSNTSDSCSPTSSSLEDDKNERYVENFHCKKFYNGKELSLDSSSVQSFMYDKKKKAKNIKKYIHSAAESSSCLKTKRQSQHSSYVDVYQQPHYSNHVNTSQQPHYSNHANAYQQPHCSSHANTYQQPHHYSHSSCSGTYQQPHHSVNFHVYPNPQNSRFSNMHCHPQHSISGSECKQHVSTKKWNTMNRDADRVKNLPCLSTCSEQHSLTCFKPSEHRCHPYNNSNFCNQRAICSQWYQMFYNQWLHIQRSCNFTS